MTPHLEAKVGDYASTVLMPGDPLRAKWIAETYLTNVKQVNSVRNCLGFTGNYRGHSVSVQASGMGQPSLSIYAHELYETYKVDNIIRVGSCGGIGNNVAIGDIVIASSASTDSNMSKLLLGNNIDINPPADWNLLESFINNIPKDIRRIVDEETTGIALSARSGINILFGTIPSTGVIIDSKKESLRVRKKSNEEATPAFDKATGKTILIK